MTWIAHPGDTVIVSCQKELKVFFLMTENCTPGTYFLIIKKSYILIFLYPYTANKHTDYHISDRFDFNHRTIPSLCVSFRKGQSIWRLPLVKCTRALCSMLIGAPPPPSLYHKTFFHHLKVKVKVPKRCTSKHVPNLPSLGSSYKKVESSFFFFSQRRPGLVW